MDLNVRHRWLSRYPYLGLCVPGVLAAIAGLGGGLGVAALTGSEVSWSRAGALAVSLGRTLVPAFLGWVWAINGYRLSLGCWIIGVAAAALTPIKPQLQYGEVPPLTPIASAFWALFSTGLFTLCVKLNKTTWMRAQNHAAD